MFNFPFFGNNCTKHTHLPHELFRNKQKMKQNRCIFFSQIVRRQLEETCVFFMISF